MTDIFSQINFDDHEQVIFITDSDAALRGIIAIHNTALGPAAGGCRMQPYESADDALNDVLRLSSWHDVEKCSSRSAAGRRQMCDNRRP